MERRFIADRGDAGIRLDLMLRRHLVGHPSATRTQVQALIRNSAVAINGTVVQRVAARTAIGDIVTIVVPGDTARTAMTAEAMPLDILHEDDELLVVNKPPGVVVHPTYGHTAQTLMNGLLWRAREWPDGQRPSIVGRLDKQTSGLVVVAKSRAIHAALQRALATPTSHKEYLAVVFGRMPPGPFGIDLRLQRDPRDRRRVVTSTSEGVAARTYVRRLREADVPETTLSLVCCRLATGRMHQIRVHLAARGWPIVGDAKYGEPRWEQVSDTTDALCLRSFARQALHAWRVTVPHPRTGAWLRVEAPLHDDMGDLVTRFFRTAGPDRETPSAWQDFPSV